MMVKKITVYTEYTMPLTDAFRIKFKKIQKHITDPYFSCCITIIIRCSWNDNKDKLEIYKAIIIELLKKINKKNFSIQCHGFQQINQCHKKIQIFKEKTRCVSVIMKK